MRMSNKTDRIQRAHHTKEGEKLNAVASLRNGVSTRAVAKKHKVTIQTIYKWDKRYNQEAIKESWDPQDINEVDSYINECVTNPECIHSIELGPEAYEQVLHLCKIEERSIDGQIRYLIKQAHAAQCNRIPF